MRWRLADLEGLRPPALRPRVGGDGVEGVFPTAVRDPSLFCGSVGLPPSKRTSQAASAMMSGWALVLLLNPTVLVEGGLQGHFR